MKSVFATCSKTACARAASEWGVGGGGKGRRAVCGGSKGQGGEHLARSAAYACMLRARPRRPHSAEHFALVSHTLLFMYLTPYALVSASASGLGARKGRERGRREGGRDGGRDGRSERGTENDRRREGGREGGGGVTKRRGLAAGSRTVSRSWITLGPPRRFWTTHPRRIRCRVRACACVRVRACVCVRECVSASGCVCSKGGIKAARPHGRMAAWHSGSKHAFRQQARIQAASTHSRSDFRRH